MQYDADLVYDEELGLYRIIEGLHSRWNPHDGQIPIGHDLFYGGVKNIFAVCGRNFGKTELAAYALWRWAKQFPNTENYIFEPYLKQAREILWASQRIQTFGPQDWIADINQSELRITFTNGSFIKLEGSDNTAAMAGIKPKGLIVYDEFKDHRKESIDNFEPNRAAHDVPALFIGTPPEFRNHFVDYMELAKGDPDWTFHHAPTSTNPHIKRTWLEKKKREILKLGEPERWTRDYEAIYIVGGKNSIFPMFNNRHRPRFDEVAPKDLNKWVLIVSFDPAASSVFGVLCALYNPFKKQTILFEEFYISEAAEMTARQVYARVQEKVIKKYEGKVKDIRFVYDEAAAFFRNEMNEVANWWLEASQKSELGIEGYINLIRTVINKGLLTTCVNLEKFIWEMESYIKDDKGRIPDKDDHLINCLSYMLQALGYNLENLNEPDKLEVEEPRGHRMDDEITFGNEYAELG